MASSRGSWVKRIGDRRTRQTRPLAQALSSFEDAAVAYLAIRMLERGIDFADALHLASSSAAERFVTFDAKLVKRARKDSPVPVVLA